jgi:alpha-N-arabinofuranosidase
LDETSAYEVESCAKANVMRYSGRANQIEKPTITFDAKAITGGVNPLLFGVNHRWVHDGCGSADPKTGLTYPRVVDQIKNVGVSMIRFPGGTLANTFQWERAIGPQEKRDMQVGGLLTMPIPYNCTFGPDEYGDLLDKTGADGNLMINCATATAADAANFVAYMTSPIGSPPVNGVDWASRRAANGHLATYKVAYVEIGNEYEPAIQHVVDQNYWIRGEAVGFTAANEAEKISRLYAFGGSTRFTNQPAVRLTDWREPTSVSTGAPRQRLYARYAPVAAGSETVYVDGTPWKGVPSLVADFGTRAYQINYGSGAITFGDGTHGAIPPNGAKITVTYTSGPHEGFVDFYRAIKAVNPNVKVCSSIHNENFIRLMGEEHPYDGIQQHPYVIGDPKRTQATGLADYFIQTVIATARLGDEVKHTLDLVRKYAGVRGGSVDMVLSEYGQLGTFPSYARHFARSQGQGVLQAICIRAWVLNQIAAAGRTVLTDYTFKPIPADLAAIQFSGADTAGDFAILAGPGPDTIVTPVAWAMKLLRENTGQKLLASSVAGSPKVTSSKGDSLDALQTFATLDAQANVYLAVINVDPLNDITATVAPANYSQGPEAAIATLASPDINDENNLATPTKVGIKEQTVVIGNGSFEATFPRHSVTAIKLSCR